VNVSEALRGGIRRLLTERQVTQVTLAAETGIHPSHLSNVLHGRRGLSLEHAELIRGFFRVEPWEMFQAEGATLKSAVSVADTQNGPTLPEDARDLLRNLPGYLTLIAAVHLVCKHLKTEEAVRLFADEMVLHALAPRPSRKTQDR
jgi:transcriptional regulator with XRE-family HTH domain